jgi:hypothetical protein
MGDNMSHLTADELAEMIGCRANSFACMRRYLTKHNWPYAPNLRGFPKVSRDYYEARMSGAQPEIKSITTMEPDFSALFA